MVVSRNDLLGLTNELVTYKFEIEDKVIKMHMNFPYSLIHTTN